MEESLAIRKTHLYLFILAALVAAAAWAAAPPMQPASSTAEAVSGDLGERFAFLSGTRTNACAGPQFIDSKGEGERLQGACCGTMDFHRYSEQVEGLKKFAAIGKIPPDPYDIPVSLARELLGYQQSIVLTPEEQEAYDKAVKLSHEGGPCCCRCWRWYAFEGLAKYLITEHGFTAEQVAEVWDLEDGCGGEGHAGHEGGETERTAFDPENQHAASL